MVAGEVPNPSGIDIRQGLDVLDDGDDILVFERAAIEQETGYFLNLVVKGDKLAGIFTVTDACRYFSEFLRSQLPTAVEDDVA